MLLYVFVLFACVLLCSAQGNVPAPQQNVLQNVLQNNYPTNLHNELSESMGNFSVELLYHATALQGEQNLILSPITTWTVLAVTAESALMNTRKQLNRALRIPVNLMFLSGQKFQEIARWSFVNTTTVQLAKFNGIFVDKNKSLEVDFQRVARLFYDTHILERDFRDAVKTANNINQGMSTITRGRIPKLVEASDFGEIEMIIASAVYFKGQWTSPFNASSTTKQPFYNSNGTQIGVVNMMYNSFTYPFANIKDIQARVIELSYYGKENSLSMLIMLPNLGVTLQDMFLNFKKVPLDIIFAELQRAREEFSEDEVDCFIPRFKIESNLNLREILKGMGIYDLFDAQEANLGRLARLPTYVTKVIHKATIEVIEEGTTSAEMAGTLPNRNGVVRFEANHPFCYLIVEKVTNTILFGGVYQQPFLY